MLVLVTYKQENDKDVLKNDIEEEEEDLTRKNNASSIQKSIYEF